MKEHSSQYWFTCGLCALAVGVTGCKVTGSLSVGAPPPPAVQNTTPKVSNVVLTLDKKTKTPTDTIKPGTADFWVMFKLSNGSKGSKIKGVLICDKCAVAPPHTKVLETSIDVKKKMDGGNFHFSKPTKGWPVGDYHVELYYDAKKVQDVPFKVVKG